MPRGIFIAFEGSEGCGKTTQIRRLAARFEKLKIPSVVIREPGSTAIGEEIRQLLQFSKAGHAMTPESELLLFTASRAQIVREIVQPALASGTAVLADRFMDSTTVYQGVARKLDPAAVRFINDFAVGGCRPDVTFVLDLDPEEARRRLLLRARPAGEPADRMEQQPPEFYEAVREGYLKLAEHEPQRVRVIAGAAPADEIEQTIWKQIEPIFQSGQT
jgi:dTMP kinase